MIGRSTLKKESEAFRLSSCSFLSLPLKQMGFFSAPENAAGVQTWSTKVCSANEGGLTDLCRGTMLIRYGTRIQE